MVNISVDIARIEAFCRRHGIVKLAFFGSVLRADFGNESDVDVLVEFDATHVPGLFGIARMERELSPILGGRRADMHTAEDLSRYFRRDVLKEAVIQYAA
jgi:hypothetical protein